MLKSKLVLLAAVIVSQIFYVKYIIIPDFQRHRLAQSIKVGQMYHLKGQDDFITSVAGITNGIVYFPWCNEMHSEDAKTFVAIWVPLTNQPPTKEKH